MEWIKPEDIPLKYFSPILTVKYAKLKNGLTYRSIQDYLININGVIVIGSIEYSSTPNFKYKFYQHIIEDLKKPKIKRVKIELGTREILVCRIV